MSGIGTDGHEESCRQMLADLYAFHDGELPEAQMDEIREHLMACEPCLDHYEVEEALRVLIRRSLTSEHASPELRERIHAAFVSVPLEG